MSQNVPFDKLGGNSNVSGLQHSTRMHEYNGYLLNTVARIFRDFSRMRSKGSRFTLGVWGLGVRSTLPNRPQPFASPVWIPDRISLTEWKVSTLLQMVYIGSFCSYKKTPNQAFL